MALLPPPPTPITLITLDWFFGRSNEMLSNSVLLLIFFLFVVLFFFNFYYSALSKNSLNFSAHLSKKRFDILDSFSLLFPSFFPVSSSSFSSVSVCVASDFLSFSCVVSSCEKRFINEDFSLLSKLFKTKPTAVAYIGLVVSASLSPAKCSLG